MVDATHQLLAVLSFQILVVGALDAEIIAFLLVGHAKHEAGQFLIGMLAADLLFLDDAALVDATVEDDERLHLAQLGLRDVEGNLVVAILLGLAFGEESLPLGGVALREKPSHLTAQRVDVVGEKSRIHGLVVEIDVIQRNRGGHELAVARENVAARGFQRPHSVFALLGSFQQFAVVLGLHHDDLGDDGHAENQDQDIDQVGLHQCVGFRVGLHGFAVLEGSSFASRRFSGSVASFMPVPANFLANTDCFEASMMADFTWTYST